MKDFLVIKKVINKDILTQINEEIIDEFNTFLSKNEKIGGLRSGNLNATIGNHAFTLHSILINSGVLEQIEKFFEISLRDHFLTVGCNINIPGSINQHVHSDTNFDNKVIIVNIPTVDVNEVNGSTEIYPESNQHPLSYLKFLLTYSGDPVRLNTTLGDIFIRDSRVWHRGMENLSSNIRPMIAFTFERKKNDHEPLNFQGAWEPFEIENNSFPERIEFLNNWFTTGYLSENYEKIIIKFPIIRSIRRIINSIIKPKGSAT